MTRFPAAIAVAAGALAVPAALGQLQIVVDPSARHQTIEGFGAAASVTWVQSVCDLYLDPSFAAQVRDDLGLSYIRIEIPPQFEPYEDLDPTTIQWWRFDLNSMYYTGMLAHHLNEGHPGAVKVLASIWSPPAWMKTNGSTGGGGHLRADRYPHFAKYCAAAALGFESAFGVPLDSLSIQNEPVFAEPFNSCQYTTDEYRLTIDAVSDAFDHWGVQTRVVGPEDTGGTNPNRLVSFVNAWRTDPVANQRMDAVALHQFPYVNEVRASSPQGWMMLKQQVAPTPLWVTEISGESPTWLDPNNELGGALYVAREIHDALVYGDVPVWMYWTVTNPTDPGQAFLDLTTPNKKYYAAKQFYRYIRPGAVRVDATGGNETVLASAYVNDQQGTMTVVLINQGVDPEPVDVAIPASSGFGSFQTIRSTEMENAVDLGPTAVVDGHAAVTLPGSSIVTLYATGAATCYANCDGSTVTPVLNVNDFICFQTRFAAGDSYANCDGSTVMPVLNVNDFICFQTRFATGCP